MLGLTRLNLVSSFVMGNMNPIVFGVDMHYCAVDFPWNEIHKAYCWGHQKSTIIMIIIIIIISHTYIALYEVADLPRALYRYYPDQSIWFALWQSRRVYKWQQLLQRLVVLPHRSPFYWWVDTRIASDWMSEPGLEPMTFSMWGEWTNHYTTPMQSRNH